MKTILTLTWLLLLGSAARGGPLEADAARREAMTGPDLAALREMLTPGLTYTHSNGLVQGRGELIDALASGVLQYVSIDVEDVQVQELRGVGIVAGEQRLEVRFRGEPVTAHGRYTATYVEEGGAWKLAGYQSTPLPTAPEAEAVPRALSAAFNVRDVDAMIDLVADDVRWLTVDGDEVLTELTGATALRGFLDGYFLAIPSVRSRVGDVLAAGRFVAFREHVRWENEAGEQTQFSLGVLEIEGRKIQRVWYFAAQEE